MHGRTFIPGPLTIWTCQHVSHSIKNLIIGPTLREGVLTCGPRVPMTFKDVIRALLTNQLSTDPTAAIAVMHEDGCGAGYHIVRVGFSSRNAM